MALHSNNPRRRKVRPRRLTCPVCKSRFTTRNVRRKRCGRKACDNRANYAAVKRHRRRYRNRYVDKVTCIICGRRVSRKRRDQATCRTLCLRKSHGMNVVEHATLTVARDAIDKQREGPNYKRIERIRR